MHCGIFEMVTMDEWRVVDCEEFEGVGDISGIEQGFFKIDLFNLRELDLN